MDPRRARSARAAAETTRAFEVIGGTALEQKIYPGAMHEIFNETNQDEVLADVTAFIDRTLPAQPA